MPEVTHAPGLVMTEHTFEVPLDHDDQGGPQLEVFAREVADPGGRDRPFLVFLQGGPGFEAVRPGPTPSPSSWVGRALQDFRLLLLDQRGTGRSSPIGDLPGLSPAEQAEYLTHFRADSIVRDAEHIRQALDVDRWSVLGQSFGGFCVTAYLSIAPEGLREAFLTGGLPPIRRPIDDVYVHTYARARERNRRYFERYPSDRGRLDRLRAQLDQEPLQLPGGDRLSWRRLRQLGQAFGISDGAEYVHHIVELPPDSRGFRYDVERAVGFSRNPLYAIIHEASYADGGSTRWAAERLLPPDFDEQGLLTGEHVYPWMFEEYGALAPLREAAQIIAEHEWPTLYDPDALAANEVPAAAAVYDEDMYVERELSMETAAQIRGLRTWVTSEYDHDGLRADGGRVLGRLIDLARGRA